MTRFSMLTAAALTAFASLPAEAQNVCGERHTIVDALEAGHHEQKTATGLSGAGGVVELFTGKSGSWTLLLTMPGGPTCLLGAGDAWEGWLPNGKSKGPQNTSLPAAPRDPT